MTDLRFVVHPLRALVAKEPFENVFTERFSHKLGAFHEIERFRERGRKWSDSGCLCRLWTEFEQVAFDLVRKGVSLLYTAHSCGKDDREGEVRVARRVGGSVFDSG